MPPLRSAAQTNLRPLQFDQIAAAAGAADPGSQPLQLVATARRSCAQAAVRSRAMYRRTRSGSPLCSRSDFRVDVPPALDWLTSSAASTCIAVATPYRKSGAGPKPSALTLSQFLSTTSAAVCRTTPQLPKSLLDRRQILKHLTDCPAMIVNRL